MEQKKLYCCCLLSLQMHKGSGPFRAERTNFVTDVVFGWGFFPFNLYTHIVFMSVNQILKPANASIDTITPINLLHSSLYLQCSISFFIYNFCSIKRVTCTAATTNKHREAP